MIEKIFNLEGKKAIVTGATGAIGFACVQVLVAFGASVLMVGRNKDKLIEAEQCLQQDNATLHIKDAMVHSYQLDFDDMDSLKTLFFENNDADILINSVGINIPKSLLDINISDYDSLMDTNVKTAFFQTQYFVESKIKKEKRNTYSPTVSIIHISSQMGFVGGEERSIYCASKHALQGMCKAIALELGQWNMRINTICPTFIETELTRSTLADQDKRKKITQSIVFERLGQLQDLYGAVAYLASDASSLVTGTAITVDGGWTAK